MIFSEKKIALILTLPSIIGIAMLIMWVKYPNLDLYKTYTNIQFICSIGGSLCGLICLILFWDKMKSFLVIGCVLINVLWLTINILGYVFVFSFRGPG